MRSHRILTPLLAALAAAALPAAAGASTISLEGNVLVVRAAPGEKNWLTVGPADQAGRVSISDISQPAADPSLCTADEYSSFVSCATPAGGVRLEAGDREDILDVQENLPAGIPVTLDGGSGNDVLRGAAFTETADRMLGGDGNDKITGGMGADDIDGAGGDDELDPRQGPDIVRGGDGNDKLGADYWQEQSTDVVDGGPGYDQIEGNWESEVGEYQPPIVVSVDGVADDGRPGENDNVTAVERIYLNAPASLTGSDGPDELTVFNTDGTGSTLNGRGGDDKLSGFDLSDTIDGGPGADKIDGGYGDDTITGGPGADVINADTSGATCSWIQCRSPYGNDHVDARDGEADSVTCGIGEDVVEADPADTVAPDCETVHRGSGGGGDNGHNPAPDNHGPASVSLSRIRALRRGGRLVVTGRATGASRVTVRVLRGRRTVARAQAPVRSGRFTARLRAPRHVRVTVKAGGALRTLKVR